MTAPDTALMAAFTRMVAEDMHTEWDSFHQFLILVQADDGQIVPRVVAILTPDIPPPAYPRIIQGLAESDIKDHVTEEGMPPPCGYLLQYEAYGVWSQDRDTMSPQDQSDLDADIRNRQLHTRADAEEACRVVCVDVTGRVYKASKRRTDGQIRTEEYAPDERPDGGLDEGVFTRALQAIARATGMAYHDQPGPNWMYN